MPSIPPAGPDPLWVACDALLKALAAYAATCKTYTHVALRHVQIVSTRQQVVSAYDAASAAYSKSASDHLQVTSDFNDVRAKGPIDDKAISTIDQSDFMYAAALANYTAARKMLVDSDITRSQDVCAAALSLQNVARIILDKALTDYDKVCASKSL